MPGQDMVTIGQAVYVRTDSPDYIEVVRPFQTLQDLFEICIQRPANLSLEKILVFAHRNGQPCAVTLSEISTDAAARPTLPFLQKK
jgi:hypothetical protein